MKNITVDTIERQLNALQSLVQMAYSEALDLPQPDDGSSASKTARHVTDLLMFARDEIERITSDFGAWHDAQCAKAAARAA